MSTPESHGYVAYTHGCRCGVCRSAKAEYMRARRAEARRRAGLATGRGYHFVDGITHGRFGYEEHGCRCPDCLQSRAELAVRLYHARKQVAS